MQALIQNFAQVEKATTSAINAEGSAMAEYSIHMDTIQASINKLKSTWQEFANIFLSSDFLRNGINTLSQILELIGQLIDKVGVLPVAMAGLSGFMTVKKSGSIFDTHNTFLNIKDGIDKAIISMQTYDSAIDKSSKNSNNFFKGLASQSRVANGMSTGLNSAKSAITGFATSAKVATIATTAFNAVASAGITLLISWGVSSILSWFDRYNEKQREAREEAEKNLNTSKENVEKYTEQAKSLDELTSKYKQLKENESDSPEARNQIADIQKQIVSLVGDEADGLDLVGGKLEGNLEKLKEYKQTLLDNKGDNILKQFEATKEKNATDDEDEQKLSWFSPQYDVVTKDSLITGKLLRGAGYKLDRNIFNNTIGIESDVNEITGEVIDSAKDAYDYYNQMKADLIKLTKESYKEKFGDDLTDKEAEGTLKYDSIYKAINEQISRFEDKYDEEKRLAQDFANNRIENLATLSEMSVKSVDDYNKYIDSIKNQLLSDDDISQMIKDGYLSEEDLDKSVQTYVSGLEDIGQFHKQWLEKYRKDEQDNIDKTNKQYKQYETVDNLADKKKGTSSYQSIIAESNSSTGLSSDMISEVERMYSNLDGYDAGKIFEKTANGIQVNRKELEKLQNQYLKEDLNQNYMALAEMTNEYKSLEVAIATCTDAEEKKTLVERRDTLEGKIEETARLTSQYEALASAYNKWIIAQNTENEGAKYDAYAGYLDQLKELNKKGLIGTDDYQSAVQLMSYEDLSGKSAGEYQKVYQKQLPMIKKYFNGQKTGILSFFKDINKQHPNWAKIKNGQWVVDLGVNGADKLAKELGVSVDLIEMLLKKSADYGANVNLSYFENDLQSIITRAKTANEALNEMGNTTHTFNFDATSIEEVNKELDIAKELYNNLPKNKDGTINVNAKGAKETISILTALIRKKQELENDNIAVLDIEIDKEKVKSDTDYVIKDLQNLKSNMDEYSLNLVVGGDTETFKNNLIEIIKNIEASNPKIRASLNLDSDEFNNALANVQNSINVGAEINQKDVDTIIKYLSGITPQMVVDAKVNDKKVKEYQKTTKKAKGELVWSNNTSKVDSYKRKEQKASGVVKWINDRGSVLTRFDATGTIDWKNNKVTNPLLRNPLGDADGSANTYVSGSAYANGKKSGDWSVGVNGKALVGELGAEIKVSNGKWELVGADSAEFVDVKNNDIK